MRLVTVSDLNSDPKSYQDLANILKEDGVICFPAESNYRLGASALSPTAVNTLMAAKRRSSHAPALIFVSDVKMMSKVTGHLPEPAIRLARGLWPGPMTLLVEPDPDAFPPKVLKALTKARGWVGVRVPGHEVARRIVEVFGGPMLVSSANISRKTGAASPAQVRKNFGRQVEAMVDSGDLPPGEPSTLVEVTETGFVIHRPGAVTAADIERVAAG